MDPIAAAKCMQSMIGITTLLGCDQSGAVDNINNCAHASSGAVAEGSAANMDLHTAATQMQDMRCDY